jgi:PAS domain S-box-containing protein
MLASFPPDIAERVSHLIRERDHLFVLHEALVEAESGTTLAARLRVFVEAVRTIGFDRVTITLRDDNLEPTLRICAGVGEDACALPGLADTGADWQRRLALLERYRISQSHYIEWGDRAAMAHLGVSQVDPSRAANILIVPVRASDGELLATLAMEETADAVRPSLARVRTVELFAQQIASHVERDRLDVLARSRAERLQLLQQLSNALSRPLDEREIIHELARGVARLVPCDGVVVAFPNLEQQTVTPLVRLVGGEPRPLDPAALTGGPIAEAARTGRPVIGVDQESPDELLGGPSASSILVVPMLVGIQLFGVIAVHAREANAYASEDAEALLTIAAQAASAISNARLFAESQRERRQSDALADVARAVSESLRTGEVMRRILRHAMALLRAEGSYVAHRQDDYLHVVAAAGSADLLAGVHVPVRGSLTGRVVLDSAAVISNDVPKERDAYRRTQLLVQAQKTVMVPLVTGRGVIGALCVLNRDADFSPEDARILQRLADQVAVAIVNARLYEEVAESTREWSVAFNSIASGMVVIDETGRIGRYNSRAVQLAGFDVPQELVGRQFYEILLHETGAILEGDPLYRALNEGVVGRATMRATKRNRVFDVIASPHPNGGAVITFDDVTVVHALAERNRLVVETATDSILLIDDQRRITFANPAGVELFGGEDRVIGKTLEELVMPEQAAEVSARDEAAMAGEPQRYECVVVRGDGTRRIVSVSAAPLKNVGRVTGLVAALRDMTDERERAQALARSEARYSNLVESASDAIFTIDLGGMFTSVNRALEHATGRKREDLLGIHYSALVDPRDVQMMSDILDATLQGKRERREIRYVDSNGAARAGSIMTSPILENGVVAGGLGIVRDVTEEKLLMEQLLQQEKLAAIGQLVSGVAHELNNPLASVMAFSELLLAPMDDRVTGLTPEQQRAEDHEMLHTINDEAKRAAKIVSNLLTFARQHAPQRAATNINDVLLATLELRRYALTVQNVDLDIQLDRGLPVTWADPFQLQQVFLNLISNAEHALGDWAGTRRITFRTWRERDTLFASVTDTGPGINAEQVDRIFNPFYTTKGVGKGTGLGLSISDGIVREHGGRIRVDSEPGRGAAFVVELPYAPPAGKPTPEARVEKTDRRPRGARSILVVDDEPAIRSAISRYLGSLGHIVDAVGSGTEALARLDTRSYDGIVLDVRMADMSGDELFAVLRDKYPAMASRTVFLTGDVQSSHTNEFLAMTGRPSVMKPFALDELARIILTD